MARIDTHAHLVPKAYRAELERRGFGAYPLPPTAPEPLLEFMERWGIDASVVSLSPPGVHLGDAGLARELARLCNEWLAALVAADPGRFAALAALPLPDADAAVAEVEYALDTLGLDGVALLSNVEGRYLGDPEWDPVFAELDRRGAYVFVHPVQPVTPSPTPEYPVWVQDFPFDTTRAAVNLIYSGTLERCPRIRLQLAHLGGATPFLAHRIAELSLREPERVERAPAGALSYMERLYYDTGLASNRIALAATRELAGIERVVFGSDWPYGAMPEQGSDPAPGLGLGEEERALVDAVNAAALVPRLSQAFAGS